jgi:hypothetical protein
MPETRMGWTGMRQMLEKRGAEGMNYCDRKQGGADELNGCGGHTDLLRVVQMKLRCHGLNTQLGLSAVSAYSTWIARNSPTMQENSMRQKE